MQSCEQTSCTAAPGVRGTAYQHTTQQRHATLSQPSHKCAHPPTQMQKQRASSQTCAPAPALSDASSSNAFRLLIDVDAWHVVQLMAFSGAAGDTITIQTHKHAIPVLEGTRNGHAAWGP